MYCAPAALYKMKDSGILDIDNFEALLNGTLKVIYF